MSIYLVGDIHACVNTLQRLLSEVNFQPGRDQLYAVGDLIGRGPNALSTLQYLHSLGDAFQSVLGNHDLHFLAVAAGIMPSQPKHQTADILASSESMKWIEWLRHMPLVIASDRGFTLVHAGIHPAWQLTDITHYAKEVETELQGSDWRELLKNMYGDTPQNWSLSLSGYDRYRFIINVLTRMRYLRPDQSMNLEWKEAVHKAAPEVLEPWYNFWPILDRVLFFGHWAALNGQTQRSDIVGLDTGCAWGESLTLYDWQTKEKISCENTDF
ncbi:MAG: bis(5'-nucleosyl)-tetraphosphatase ApaH [Idiomarinaceae bacterium HL-53]|nr:MAG: bis(5'-nucleosyl)-tetraphosphatase ApaH [Idiomarinaceae bacterium HL-53]CUS48261.1 Bis(5'nucleosyl)-tetraphosphatase, ApaH [Idiomarinaceae bacterium HL-53]